MSQVSNQLTISKVAYVDGVANTLGELKLASWGSRDDFEFTVQKVASLLPADPAQVEFEPKLAAEICDAVIKVAEYMKSESCDKEKGEMRKKKKEHAEKMEDSGEKKASMDYLTLFEYAQHGARKIAAYKRAQEVPTGEAQNGMNPGQANITGNSLPDATAHDSLAQIENRRRPQGYAESVPDDRDLGAQIGVQQRHSMADMVGRTNSSGGFQPARKSASDVMYSLFGNKQAQDTPSGEAQNGMNPGQGNMTGNSLSDAAAHDSLSQIENRRRPQGYAENAPDDNDLGAQIGSQSTHGMAHEVGRTNSSPGAGFQPAGSGKEAAMHGMKKDKDIEKLPPALKEKAYKKKKQHSKKALFEEAGKVALELGVLSGMRSQEDKIALVKEAMYLEPSDQIAFFQAWKSY